MKRSPIMGRRNSAHGISRPYSMFIGSQYFKSSHNDLRIASLVDEISNSRSPNLSLVKELKRLKRNSSAESLNANLFSDFTTSDLDNDLLASNKKKRSSSRKKVMPQAGRSAHTWVVPKSIKKLPTSGHVFGVHISKTGVCYASVVSEKGERLIQAFDRNGNLMKSFQARTAKGGKTFEPYQIFETPDGHLAVASGNSVTVWSKEGKLITEHGKGMFKFAKSLSVRSTGEIVVADTDNQCVKIISANGQHIYKLDGNFTCPVGVAVDSNDSVIVSDWSDQISIFDAENELLNTFGIKGSNLGELDLPYGVSVDSENNVVVADMWNHRLSVYNQQGQFLRNIVCEPGHAVRLPAHISVASGLTPNDYRLAVTDFGADCVKLFSF